MRVTTINIEPEELAGLKGLLGLDGIAGTINTINERQDQLMADFTALNNAIQQNNDATRDLADELTAAVARVEEDVQALRDAASDEVDQAAVQEITTRLSESTTNIRTGVDRLKGLDPIPPVEEPTDPDAPANP